MSENKLVKDYSGVLVPKKTARSISGKYYTIGTSCFLMEDGQWYRIDSPKLAYDSYNKKYVLVSSTPLTEGIINEKGDRGYFPNSIDFINSYQRRGESRSDKIMTEDIAIKCGYVECIGDGNFYKKSLLTSDDLKTWFIKKDIPKSERSSDYNLESNPDKKRELIEKYEKSKFPISISARKLAKYLGDFTFGAEFEIINGWVPRRIRSEYGLKALKDGSLRHDNGEGIELVTMPMRGAKGIQTIIDVCKELSKRAVVNNYCSLHYHFGNVRRDKIYVLSTYKLVGMLQDELKKYFPFSRFNSIKPDGKVYCKALEKLPIDYKGILSSPNEEVFKAKVIQEFNHIYKWLNNGKALAEEFAPPSISRELKVIDGKKMFCDSWLKNVYTTKLVNHAVTGQKWQKESRYYIVNFLNLFFNTIGTIELTHKLLYIVMYIE